MSLYAGGAAATFAKDVWLKGYLNQFEHAPGTLYGYFGKQVEKLEGRRTFRKLRVGDSVGGGVMAEGGDFFPAGDVESAEATLTAAHLSHTISFTDEEIAYLDSGNAAAAPIMQMKMDAAMEAMGRYIERMAWSDGTGVLARWASDSTNDMVISADATNQTDRDRFIWIDDANRNYYSVVHGTTGAAVVGGPLRITAIDEATNTLTFDASVAAATTASVVVPYSTGGWASGGAFRSLEFPGLRAMISNTGTYLGIDRGTAGNKFWHSTVLDNSGTQRAITEDLVHSLMNRVRRRLGSGKAPSKADYIAWASPGTWTAYHNLMSPAIRYTGNENMPDIGWPNRPLNMMGVPLYDDIHCPRNSIFLVRKKSVEFYRAKHEGNVAGDLMSFIERGGSIFFQATASSGAGYAASTLAMLNGFLGMGTTRPRDHGLLTDLTENSSAY